MKNRLFYIMTAAAFVITAGSMSLISAAEKKSGGGEFVGADTCVVCHDDTVKAFKTGRHSAAMAAKSADLPGQACEHCHGPGAAHADDPSKTNINRDVGSEACLSCHPKAGSSMALNLPAHARSNIACRDCHNAGHGNVSAQPLLLAEPRIMCARCHGEIAAAFKMPFTHRKGDVGFNCTECHTVHGDNRTGRLRQWEKSSACLECHTDKTGPFVYPHPPRSAYGCLECHKPHGSPNPKMLTRSRVQDLCLQCHTGIPSFHKISSPKFQSCQVCHLAVHGSNHDPNLKDE
jgi:DmsE family decaheme c-type cytochrome